MSAGSLFLSRHCLYASPIMCAETKPPGSSDSNLHKEAILCIVDDETNQMFLQDTLRSPRYRYVSYQLKQDLTAMTRRSCGPTLTPLQLFSFPRHIYPQVRTE